MTSSVPTAAHSLTALSSLCHADKQVCDMLLQQQRHNQQAEKLIQKESEKVSLLNSFLTSLNNQNRLLCETLALIEDKAKQVAAKKEKLAI